jgi:hypothetical protein
LLKSLFLKHLFYVESRLRRLGGSDKIGDSLFEEGNAAEAEAEIGNAAADERIGGG